MDDKINEGDITQLRKLLKDGQQSIKEILPIVREKGREFEERSLLVQSFILSGMRQELAKVQTYKDLIESYAKIFYDIKS